MATRSLRKRRRSEPNLLVRRSQAKQTEANSLAAQQGTKHPNLRLPFDLNTVNSPCFDSEANIWKRIRWNSKSSDLPSSGRRSFVLFVVFPNVRLVFAPFPIKKPLFDLKAKVEETKVEVRLGASHFRLLRLELSNFDLSSLRIVNVLTDRKKLLCQYQAQERG